VKGEEGELFGVANLFKMSTSHVMTNGMVISEERGLQLTISKRNY
jgi:hypothetical protein